MEILALENLSFSYPTAKGRALNNVTLRVAAGEFVVLCGQSGCGKTTLLRLIKRELAPHGEETGDLLFCGTPLREIDQRDSARRIGMVLQNPEAQIVTDRVWHELAFGPESLGEPTDEIRRRVAETASWFGINGWFRQETAYLSGGQKQLLNLAAVMTMSPELLLLDEPTAQLDPIAASSFLHTLYRINRELGVTVIVAEHRLEELFPVADRVGVMEGGELVACDTPRNISGAFGGLPVAAGFPSAVRIAAGIGASGRIPLTVREGRDVLAAHTAPVSLPLPESSQPAGEPALTLKNIWFRYGREETDILRGTSVRIGRGELFSVLGGNGSGKTTLLRVMAGTAKPYRGKVLLGDGKRRVALLPQNIQTLFLGKTVREDLEDLCRMMGEAHRTADADIWNVAERLELVPLLERHPYDLSGGEGQRAALAKLLLTKPDILLLDEPTKGIDAWGKQKLAGILRRLTSDGVTVVLVTHDLPFAAEVSDRCAMLFDGELMAPAAPQVFFSSNRFYTTVAGRIAHGLVDGAVTVEQVVRAVTRQEDGNADG